jgi:hypothetical protein
LSDFRGENKNWNIKALLGSGIDGEAFWVESDEAYPVTGVLKRSSNRINYELQAAHIASEGEIVNKLDGLSVQCESSNIKVCRLLDRSPDHLKGTASYFIVTERSPGFTIDDLMRLSRSRFEKDNYKFDLTPIESYFIEKFSGQKFPILIILRAIVCTYQMFNKIHASSIGVIWNDIKSEHYFWDPSQSFFTIIDWGNGYFIDEDGISLDRKFSKDADYAQFVETFIKLIDLVDIGSKDQSLLSLANQIEEPISIRAERLYYYAKNKLTKEERLLSLLRQDEESILNAQHPKFEDLRKLLDIHSKIIAFGELPQFNRIDNYKKKLVAYLASEGKFDEILWTCDQFSEIPFHSTDSPWELIRQVASLKTNNDSRINQVISNTIQYLLSQNYIEALWEILSPVGINALTDDWVETAYSIRQEIVKETAYYPTPLKSVLQLRTNIINKIDKLDDEINKFKEIQDWRNVQSLGTEILNLKEKVLPELDFQIDRWEKYEPSWPEADIRYSDIETFLSGIIDLFPSDVQQVLANLSFKNAKKQVEFVLDAWENEKFDNAVELLRKVIVWDPNRFRIIKAADTIVEAQDWLVKFVRKGPQGQDDWNDYVLSVITKGTNFIAYIGPTTWLTNIVSFFKINQSIDWKEIESGKIYISPELQKYVPWLERKSPTPAPKSDNEDRKIIDKFYDYLRTWDYGELRELLEKEMDPQWRSSYEALFAGFEAVWNGNYEKLKVIDWKRFPDHDTHISEAKQVLRLIQEWRQCNANYGLRSGIETYARQFSSFKSWLFVDKIIKYQDNWKESVLPVIEIVLNKPSVSYPNPKKTEYAELLEQILIKWKESGSLVRQLDFNPLRKVEIDKLQTEVRQMKFLYQDWVESTPAIGTAEVLMLLEAKDWKEFHSYINDLLLKANKFSDSRQLWDDSSYSKQNWKNAERLLDAYIAITAFFFTPQEISSTAQWRREFDNIYRKRDSAEIEDLKQEISRSNPLYEWLNSYSPACLSVVFRKYKLAFVMILLLLICMFPVSVLYKIIQPKVREQRTREFIKTETPVPPMYQLTIEAAKREYLTNSPPTPFPTKTDLPQPTFTHTPSPEPSPILTPTVEPSPVFLPEFDEIINYPLEFNLAEQCSEFDQLTLEGNWDDILAKVKYFTEQEYEIVRASCGWTLSLEHRILDLEMLILQDKVIEVDSESAKSLLATWLNDHQYSEQLTIGGEDSNNYLKSIYWLRTTNAYCDFKNNQVTKEQAELLLDYLDWHIQQVPDAELSFIQICGYPASEVRSYVEANLRPENIQRINLLHADWPIISPSSTCLYKDGSSPGIHFLSMNSECSIPYVFIPYGREEILEMNFEVFGLNEQKHDNILFDFSFALESFKNTLKLVFLQNGGSEVAIEYSLSKGSNNMDSFILANLDRRILDLSPLLSEQNGSIDVSTKFINNLVFFVVDGKHVGLLPVILPDGLLSEPVDFAFDSNGNSQSHLYFSSIDIILKEGFY